MKGTLMKQGGYKLYINNAPYATSDNSPYKKLSLKNCEAIANGYDLDELEQNYIKSKTQGWHQDEIEKYDYEVKEDAKCFIEGAKAILELLGDKKFSEDDIRKAILFGQGMELWKEDEQIQRYIQSLQQLEWSVEVEMEKVKDKVKTIGAVKGVKGSGHKITTYKSVPKVDENGCLILKRITL